MTMFALLLALSLPAASAEPACPEGADTTDLTTAISDAEATFTDLDIAAFKEATDRLRGLLPCLGDPLTRHLSAEVHRFLGIRAFGDRDPDAKLYFAAARAIEPDYTFPPSLIPEGNPVRTAYADYDLSQARVASAPEPASGSLQFDARTTLERPAAWPTIYQRLDESGAVVETAYLMPADPVPTYPMKQVRIVAVAPQPEPIGPTDPPRPVAPPLRTPLLVGTVAAAASTGLLYGLAGVSHATFHDTSTPDADLDGLRTRTNTLVVTSAVTGALTVGLGIGFATTF